MHKSRSVGGDKVGKESSLSDGWVVLLERDIFSTALLMYDCPTTTLAPPHKNIPYLTLGKLLHAVRAVKVPAFDNDLNPILILFMN
jgi:hypothetical protein